MTSTAFERLDDAGKLLKIRQHLGTPHPVPGAWVAWLLARFVDARPPAWVDAALAVIRSRWNFEENEFDAIEKVLLDPECAAVIRDQPQAAQVSELADVAEAHFLPMLDAARNYIRLLESNSAGHRVDIYEARASAKRKYEAALSLTRPHRQGAQNPPTGAAPTVKAE